KLMFSEAPPSTITHSAINAGYCHQFISSDHQEELKSVKTEFIKEDREKMRDPEHTEDTEEQT
ncbi:hypothetical protein QQF64_026211, partial [Cirrhinus molitorella]